jgi:methionyl-tRNA synthetase
MVQSDRPCFPDGPSLLEDEAEGELQRLLELKTMIDFLPSTVDGLMRQGRVGTATARIMKLLSMANAHFQANQPWADKSGIVGGRKDRATWCALESLRVSLLLLQPILPESANRGLDMIGVPQGAENRCGPEVLEFAYVNDAEEDGCSSREFVEPGVLFSRIERDEL